MPRPSKTLVLPVGEAIIKSVVDPTAPRILTINSGVGAGKSYALAQGVHLAAATRPRSNHLVSAGTYPLLMSVLQPRIAEASAGMSRFVGGSTSGHPRFIYPNGSIIYLVSYRLHSTQDEAKNPWEGTDYSTLWVDEIEQLPSTVFDHSFQRCRLSSWDWNDTEHQPLFVWSGRPGAVYHWMEKGAELKAAGRHVAELVFPTRSNWTLSPDYLDNMRASMSYEEFACVTQEVIGARMPVKGAIYRGFSTARGRAHDIDPARGTMRVSDPETGYNAAPGNLLQLPRLFRDYPTYAAIDFGVTTSAVVFVQEWEINGSPASVIVDEWCPDTPTDTPALVSGIRSRGWQLAEAICDPAGEQRQRAAGLMSEVRILRRGVEDDPDGLGPGLGVPVCSRVPPVRARVRDGVLRVAARIRAADGSRQLFVASHLWDSPEGQRGVRDTILRYEWGSDGEPLKGRAGHHADHVADALRLYVIRRAWDGLGGARAAQVTAPAAPSVASMFGRR